jgi:hypothetical protein
MELDYRKREVLKVNMTKYVENMINEFPVKLGKKDVAKTPAGDNLFNLGTEARIWIRRDPKYSTRSWRKDYSFAKGPYLIFNK